jgi:hypothetical protein
MCVTRVIRVFLAGFTTKKVNLDLGFTVDLRSTVELSVNCLANAAAPDPHKGIFVGMAKIALGHQCSLYLTASPDPHVMST